VPFAATKMLWKDRQRERHRAICRAENQREDVPSVLPSCHRTVLRFLRALFMPHTGRSRLSGQVTKG